MTYRGSFEGILGDHLGEVEGGEPRVEGGAREGHRREDVATRIQEAPVKHLQNPRITDKVTECRLYKIYIIILYHIHEL